ncbi:MAG: hypothetical protein LBH18_00920, partial [Spirochaetaceae bacterium]|nr:hypothetical protein [Spirochaetaceae bacterium]
MKNYRKLFCAALAAFAFAFAGCTDGGADIAVMQTPPTTGTTRDPPPDGLRLKQLKVYYADDMGKSNLVKPVLSSNNGDYTVPDAEESRGTLIVEAVTEGAETTALISWSYKTLRGAMPEAAAATDDNPAMLDGVYIPPANSSEKSDTLITIQVSNGSKKYNYYVGVKAPGTDSSLESLVVRYDTNSTTLLTGVGNEFNSSRYDYTVEVKDSSKETLIIHAKPLSKGSVVELLNADEVRAAPVTLPEPEATLRLGTLFDDESGDPLGGDGDGASDEAAEPTEAAWSVPIPEAGSAAIVVKLKVVNGDISSNYAVTIVPPQKADAVAD